MGDTRVLLIDGQAGWAGSVAQALGEFRPDARVDCCRSAVEALRVAEEHPVGLAMANLVLPRPGLGGASTLLRLRELYPDCRTVLVTDQGALGSLLHTSADELVSQIESRELTEAVLRVAGDVLPVGPPGVGRADPGRSTVAIHPPQPEPALLDPPPSIAPGRLVGGKYRPLDEIGKGGMGRVFRAEDTFIHRTVALKLMRVPESADPDEMRQRMRREVTIAGRLTHPHVVTIYDAGVDQRAMYLVMELIDGPTLSHLLRERGALPSSKAVAICLQILDALSLAHGLRFVHRDLKPSNVLLTRDGVVKVADFGLAKLMSSAESTSPTPLVKDLTVDERIIGTPKYMAPEQLRGEVLDARADLYAVGLILFEMLHGEPLAKYVRPLQRAAAFGDRSMDPDLPVLPGEPELQEVLERALALSPDDRFGDAADFAQALATAGRSSWAHHLRWPFDRFAGDAE